MMFFIKKFLFKLMELGLGVRTTFSLETRNPVFINFRLSEEEARRVQAELPTGFHLQKIRFCESDIEPEYWISYNLYEIRYPRKELGAIRKSRCEINTFVTDGEGRKGIYVFCGSPYVSKEEKTSLLGSICDLAERMVVFIYGCGRLTSLRYEVREDSLRISFHEPGNFLSIDHGLVFDQAEPNERLSDEFCRYNDISFFNRGKSYDLVNVNSAFLSARFHRVAGEELRHFQVEGPYFRRSPDSLYLHRGDITYIVSAMNRCRRPRAQVVTA